MEMNQHSITVPSFVQGWEPGQNKHWWGWFDATSSTTFPMDAKQIARGKSQIFFGTEEFVAANHWCPGHWSPASNSRIWRSRSICSRVFLAFRMFPFKKDCRLRPSGCVKTRNLEVWSSIGTAKTSEWSIPDGRSMYIHAWKLTWHGKNPDFQ